MKEQLKDIEQFTQLDLNDDYHKVYANKYNSKEEIKKIKQSILILIASAFVTLITSFLTKGTKYDLVVADIAFSDYNILELIILSVVIFLTASGVVTFCFTFLVGIFVQLLSIIENKHIIKMFKQQSNSELLDRYLDFRVEDIQAIKNLNTLYINKDNVVKRKYEFLDFEANNLNYLQFTDDIEQFEMVNDMADDYSELIKEKSQHTKLDYSDLQIILKNYVMIVKSNAQNKQEELESNLIISDFSDVYEKIVSKYSQRA